MGIQTKLLSSTISKTKNSQSANDNPIVAERLSSFMHQGLTFNVIDTGPLTGEPVVLLHGFPEMASSWQKVSAILNKQGFRTFAMDQRGYSLTAAPRGRFQYGLDELVGDVAALIDIIDTPVYLIGHDWGSLVACEFALNYPEKVKHLTLVSVPHKGAYVEALISTSQFFSSYYIAFFQLPLIPELIFKYISPLKTFFLKNSGMSKEQIQLFNQDFIEENRISKAIHWYRSLVLSSPFSMFKKVKVSTLFIWSDRDIAIHRQCAERNQKYFSQQYKAVFLTATHWIPSQNADELCSHFLNAIQKG